MAAGGQGDEELTFPPAQMESNATRGSDLNSFDSLDLPRVLSSSPLWSARLRGDRDNLAASVCV